ncbi:hypothetical protein B0H12DRAFT_828109 [Mycena haematopus]|nr:hypothetical protein B0H12DRAFT_828109 [Mycena haematopus]
MESPIAAYNVGPRGRPPTSVSVALAANALIPRSRAPVCAPTRAHRRRFAPQTATSTFVNLPAVSASLEPASEDIKSEAADADSDSDTERCLLRTTRRWRNEPA